MIFFSNKYQFRYEFLGQESSKETHSPSESFTIHADELEHGQYHVKFFVDEFIIFTYFEKTKASSHFTITNRFNGLMVLKQNSPNETVRNDGYVSSTATTIHDITISDKDRKLYDKAAYIRVYWFVNCVYLGK